MNTHAASAGSLIIAASAHNATPGMVRRSSASATPATISPAISPSLCPAATTCSSISGLSTASQAARLGSDPSATAIRGTNTPSSTSPQASIALIATAATVTCEPASPATR